MHRVSVLHRRHRIDLFVPVAGSAEADWGATPTERQVKMV
jgi:hypothetical protein